MNPSFQEINEIIVLCDKIVNFVRSKGNIRNGNSLYNEYKKRINDFVKEQGLSQRDYAPYVVLDSFYFSSSSYSLNISEAEMIYRTVVDLKHKLFPNSFDGIFISHREKNKDQVTAFIDLLYSIGISRPTATQPESMIFCTSHPATYLGNGSRNLEEIKEQFTNSSHTFYILWYTDDYFESQACLNEAGAIWAMGKKYQEILSPKFDSKKIGRLLDKQPVWFKADDKFRLNSFKEQIEQMFGLAPISANAWEMARDTFIKRIQTILEKAQEKTK